MATGRYVNIFARRKFLLIEDFDVMRGILRDMLRRCGAEHVDTAANVRDAQAQLRREKYDVVMCDFNLGEGKNGQMILEEARHDDQLGPNAIWIMITAEKTVDMVMGVAEYAPDDYLVKPIIEATLYARLQKLVERKAQMAEINAAVHAKQYLRALGLCAQRLEQDRGNAMEVLRIQADLLQLTGKADDARGIFESILARRQVPWARLGMAKLAVNARDFAKARTLLEELIASHPNYLEAYDLLAHVHHRQGAAEDEHEVLTKSAALSPNSQSRQSALGSAALRCGQPELASKAYQRAIKLGEHSALKSPAPFVGLARVHSVTKKPQEALQLLSQATQLFGSDEAKLQLKAEEVHAHHTAGDEKRAAELAREVSALVQSNPQAMSPEAMLDLAETLMAAGSREEASQLLQSVARNNDEDELIAKRAQAVFDQAGIGDQGRELLNQSRQHAREAMNEGVSLMAEGKLAEAIERMRSASALMPHNPRVLLNLAYVLIASLEKEGWQRDIEAEARKAVSTALMHAPGEKRAGELLARLEQLAQAAPRAGRTKH